MNKEIITNKQMIILIIMFLAGTTALIIPGMDGKEDFWISIIISILMTIPVVIIISRFNNKLPGKNLFDVIEICFGKYIGKIIMIAYAYYFLEEGTLVLINFGQFVNTAFLNYTPNIVIMISIMLLSVWTVKSGIKVLGKWAEFMFIVFLFFIISSVLFAIPRMDINNIRPVFYNGINPILKGAFMAFTFPFGEITTFSMVFTKFKEKKSSLKVYLTGLLFGGGIMLIISTTTIFVLGANRSSMLFHPTFTAISRINVFDTIQRIEVVISTVYALGAFIKISIYFFATSKCFAKIFNIEDYKTLVVPIGLFMIILSNILFIGVLDYWDYNAGIWPYYAIIFEMILPIIIFVILQIRSVKFMTN
ncbi:GerAB/ArcD/ProY family transporter [Abyssisolibacter fermentans]|uniref:GerAB/ArcD/ProY family transporter n=1 Tax=Abyssisolibacter fermentans TaxID=1766203 RepID=UPI000829AD4C|nr:endospore germination permease [Abyssisolibacter fermentans]